ncbi:hypothetical protein J4476_03485 [Candidatus Woesearchaeota archaeon]|nr:MAG: hypothetical protein QT09_C0006G0099 [archaeon GW2011_AR18]MBS3161730.1 hypothetical protein [Candidatus Woesearchaeota archaeon]HIH26314.1 hypothetical protein [Nanoarchaeota archaeon]
MNKKGQVFLIAAIIFIFAIYSVIITYNKASEYAALEDYDALTENYQNEFPKVANKALLQEDDVNDKLKDFNQQFIDNAREKDPNYGALYAYKDQQGILHIVNTLTNKVVNIQFNSETTSRGLKDIQLLSDTSESPGNINLEGVGDTGVSTETSRYGATWNNEQNINLGDITKIKLTITDERGRTSDIELDVKDFTTLNYISSEQELSTTSGRRNNLIQSATLTTS